LPRQRMSTAQFAIIQYDTSIMAMRRFAPPTSRTRQPVSTSKTARFRRFFVKPSGFGTAIQTRRKSIFSRVLCKDRGAVKESGPVEGNGGSLSPWTKRGYYDSGYVRAGLFGDGTAFRDLVFPTQPGTFAHDYSDHVSSSSHRRNWSWIRSRPQPDNFPNRRRNGEPVVPVNGRRSATCSSCLISTMRPEREFKSARVPLRAPGILKSRMRSGAGWLIPAGALFDLV